MEATVHQKNKYCQKFGSIFIRYLSPLFKATRSPCSSRFLTMTGVIERIIAVAEKEWLHASTSEKHYGVPMSTARER